MMVTCTTHSIKSWMMATIVQSSPWLVSYSFATVFHVNDKSVVFMIDSSFALFFTLPEKYPFCVTQRGGVSFGSNQYTYNPKMLLRSENFTVFVLKKFYFIFCMLGKNPINHEPSFHFTGGVRYACSQMYIIPCNIHYIRHSWYVQNMGHTWYVFPSCIVFQSWTPFSNSG